MKSKIPDNSMNPLQLRKTSPLKPGDTIATVSLSWGGAGDPEILWRYQVAKERLESQFGLRVIEMPHTLKGSAFLYENPQLRAQDLMEAFKNPKIKGIFSCIGGDDSIRLLPYIDFECIAQNPKPFLGYSDSTVTHFMCLKAGISSIYGPSMLAEFGENVEIFPYTKHWFERTLFSAEPLGTIPIAPEWTGERIEWLAENALLKKQLQPNTGGQLLSGHGGGVVTGHLIGGCLEVLEMLKGTALWPAPEAFDGAILFLETSEEMPTPEWVLYWLRNYAAMGVLHRIRGILFAKPYQGIHQEAYHEMILKVLKEAGLTNLPVLANMSFGHNQPMMCIPYGAIGEIDTDCATISIF